jgi:acylphosphatase
MTDEGAGRAAADPVLPRARFEAVISGRVQGVGFRAFVYREASLLGLGGWVANEPDGSERCQAEGARTVLDRLVARLWEGPRAAMVDDVRVRWLTPTGRDDDFHIRSGWHLGD